MKYLFKILLILFFSLLNNLIASTEEVDEAWKLEKVM